MLSLSITYGDYSCRLFILIEMLYVIVYITEVFYELQYLPCIYDTLSRVIESSLVAALRKMRAY